MDSSLKQVLTKVSNLCSNNKYFIFANGKAYVGNSVYIKDEKEGWKKCNETMESVLFEIPVCKNLNTTLEEYRKENESTFLYINIKNYVNFLCIK